MNIFHRIIAALFAISIFMACPSCHHHEHDEHHHHHDGEQITAYSDQFELFAEVSPFIVGEHCDVAAHLTRLSNFKPLDSVKVALSLTVNGKTLRQVADQPDQPGIYRFHLHPETSGTGQLLVEIFESDSTYSILADGITVYPDHDAYHHALKHHNHHGHSHSHGDEEAEEHEEHEHSAAGLITFSKEQSWKVDFATEELQPAAFGQIIRTSAQVLPSQGDERDVAAKASGIVLFANSGLTEGASVSAGQRLFSIESSGMADNNLSVRFQDALSKYNLAKQEYERKQGLAADKIVSQTELDRAKSELDRAEAEYSNLKRNFSQGGQSVTAPIGGFVKNIAVRNGAYVEAGQPIVTISQNRDLFVKAEVQPRYYSCLSSISGANFVANGITYSIDSMGGALVSYGRATDPSNPLIPVTFRFSNRVNLLPGSFVTLYIRTLADTPVLSIPNTGIVEEMGSYFVFVQHTPESFEKRQVNLGATDGFRTEIKSGVNPGERVVSKGAMMVKLSQGAGALDPHAGHVH